jgi:hypothetical protein
VRLLELFCYGTWPDYTAQAAALPPLSEQQRHKLKQLTVVSLATESKLLAYDRLMGVLELGSTREVRVAVFFCVGWIRLALCCVQNAAIFCPTHQHENPQPNQHNTTNTNQPTTSSRTSSSRPYSTPARCTAASTPRAAL